MPEKSLHQRIDEAIEAINELQKTINSGTFDFGNYKETKILRVQAIALAKAHYYSD